MGVTKLEQQGATLTALREEYDGLGAEIDDLNARAYEARQSEIENAPTQGASAVSPSSRIQAKIGELEKRRTNLRRDIEIRSDLLERETRERMHAAEAARAKSAREAFEAQHARGNELISLLFDWWADYAAAAEAYGEVVPEGDQPEQVWADLRAITADLWSPLRPELGRLSACARRSDDSRAGIA